MRVVFFGTPSYAAHILEYLLDREIDVVGVVTQPPRPKRRSGVSSWEAVGALAHERQLSVLAPERASDPKFLGQLAEFKADVFLVVAYGQILRQQVLDMPPLGCFNAHGSILPDYRGAAPIQRALMDGVKETGVTIIAMNAEMDAGDMIRVARIPVDPNATFKQVESDLCRLSQQEFIALLDDLERRALTRRPQNHFRATFAPKLRPQDGRIQWDKNRAEVHNLIRALSPKPGAWCEVKIGTKSKRLKILASAIPSSEQEGQWLVSCSDGLLDLLQVQLEGKHVVSGEEFLRGAVGNLHLS